MVETKNSVVRRFSLLLPKGVLPDIQKEKEKLLAEITAESKVFGVDLKTAVLRSNKSHYLLPAVVYKCLTYLGQRGVSEEGIFRLSGSVADMKKMKEQFDQGSDVNVTLCNNPHTVAGVLKLFLRELPTPLIQADIDAGDTNVVGSVKSMIDKLSEEAKCLLGCLFTLLAKVSKQEEVTKMGVTNLVIVFSPALQCSGTIVTTLIKHAATIFPENQLEKTTNTFVFAAKTEDVHDNINSPRGQNTVVIGTARNNNNSNTTVASANIPIPIITVENEDGDIFKLDDTATKTDVIIEADIDVLISKEKLLKIEQSRGRSKSGSKVNTPSGSKNNTPTGSRNNTPVMSRWRKKNSLFDGDDDDQ